MARRILATLEALRGRCEVLPIAGCWIWTGATQYQGYAVLTGHRSKMAHRLAFEFAKGPIADGMFVLHRCDVRCCINPDHLFLGTQADNMADMDAKGRRRTGRNWSERSACKNGHPYLPGSFTINLQHNARLCKQCRVDIGNRARVRHRGAQPFRFIDRLSGNVETVYAKTLDRAWRCLGHRHYSVRIASEQTIVELLTAGQQVLDATTAQGELPEN